MTSALRPRWRSFVGAVLLAGASLVATAPSAHAAPNPADDSVVGVVGSTTWANLLANDGVAAGDEVVPFSVDTPLGRVVVVADGSFSFAATHGGTFDLTYQVCSPGPPLDCATGTVTLLVAPVSAPDSRITVAGRAVTIDVSANDATGPGVTNSVDVAPTAGTVSTLAGGEFVYTPHSTFAGDSFAYQSCVDGVVPPLCGDPVTVRIDEFIASPVVDTAVGAQGSSTVVVDVLGNDLSAAGTSVEVVRAPEHGQVTLAADGTATYVADAGWTGDDTWSYRLCAPAPDADACSAPAQVAVTVRPAGVVNPTPTQVPTPTPTPPATQTPVTVPVTTLVVESPVVEAAENGAAEPSENESDAPSGWVEGSGADYGHDPGPGHFAASTGHLPATGGPALSATLLGLALLVGGAGVLLRRRSRRDLTA